MTNKTPFMSIVLFDAVRRGNLAEVERLLSAGADVEARDELSQTLLHYACWGGHPDVVRMLIERGADVGVRDDGDGFTPLHQACFWGHADVARLLIDRGADVGARDKHNNTPLDFACDLPESDPTREPLLEIFRDRFPEAWFTKFCESPGRASGRGM